MLYIYVLRNNTQSFNCGALPCLLRALRLQHAFMSSCVSAELCCWGCVTQGVTTRRRDLGSRTMLVFVQRPLSGGWVSQIARAWLPLLHALLKWKESGQLDPVCGSTDRGKTPVPHCYISVMEENEVFESCLVGACAVWTVWAGCSSAVSGGSRNLGAGGWLAVCVLAGSLLCVNRAELKESFTERGSVKGMCRMWLGSSMEKTECRGEIYRKYIKIKK